MVVGDVAGGENMYMIRGSTHPAIKTAIGDNYNVYNGYALKRTQLYIIVVMYVQVEGIEST